MMKESAFMLLALALVVIPLFLWKRQVTARRLRKRTAQGFTDPEQLAELLDEWNRKHRPDLWSNGGDWPEGKDFRAERQEASTTLRSRVAMPAMFFTNSSGIW